MTENPKKPAQNHQPGPATSGDRKLERAPEERPVRSENERDIKEKNLDKTIADSFPTSDPPSSIPNPGEDEDVA